MQTREAVPQSTVGNEVLVEDLLFFNQKVGIFRTC